MEGFKGKDRAQGQNIIIRTVIFQSEIKVDFKMARVWQFLSGYTSLTVKERSRARSTSHLFKEFRQSTFCAVVLLSHQKTDARVWGIRKLWPGKKCRG